MGEEMSILVGISKWEDLVLQTPFSFPFELNGEFHDGA